MKSGVDSKNWQSVLVAIVALFFESLLLYFYYKESTSFAIPLMGHILVVVALLLFAYWSYKQKVDLRYPLLLLLSVFCAGPFGLAGFLLLALLYPLLSLFATPAEIWMEGLFPQQDLNAFSKLYQRVRLGWNDYDKLSEVASFQDLFTYGSISQKQTVLDVIAKDFRPEYSPLLNNALKDPNNIVRIQAAAIVTKIDLDFDLILQKKILKHEENLQNDTLKLALAEQYDTYASSGILDKVRENQITASALSYYQDYLKHHPLNRNIWCDIGRLLFRRGEYENYISWSERFEKEFTTLPSIYHIWYLESLYRLGRYEELSNKKSRGL